MKPATMTGPQYDAYVRALGTSTSQRWQIDVLTLDHRPVASTHAEAVTGSVQFVRNADVDRTMSMAFFDPDNELRIATDNPTDGAIGFDRLIQVKHSLFVPELTDWATIDVFTGVPVIPERSGDQISLELHDKAIRCLPPRDIGPYPIQKGELLVPAIKAGLRRCGETRFAFPDDSKARVTHRTIIGGPHEDHAPWRQFRRLARKAGYQLFYDRSGRATMRRPPQTPLVTWTTDADSSTLTEFATFRTDFSTLKNRVRVHGKKGVNGQAQLPDAHPFSARSLRSGGRDCHLTLWHEDGNIHSDREADRVAERILANNLLESIEARFSAVPVLHLDPGDLGGFDSSDRFWTFRIREATIPLDDGDLSIGYQRRIRRPNTGRILARAA